MLNPWTPRTAAEPPALAAAAARWPEAEPCNWVLSSLELRHGLIVREWFADMVDGCLPEGGTAHCTLPA
jgi:hypothetical protein